MCPRIAQLAAQPKVKSLAFFTQLENEKLTFIQNILKYKKKTTICLTTVHLSSIYNVKEKASSFYSKKSQLRKSCMHCKISFSGNVLFFCHNNFLCTGARVTKPIFPKQAFSVQWLRSYWAMDCPTHCKLFFCSSCVSFLLVLVGEVNNIIFRFLIKKCKTVIEICLLFLNCVHKIAK